MFEKIKQYVVDNWKRAAFAAGAGAVAFVAVKYAVSSLLSLSVVAGAAGVAAVYFVWTSYAWFKGLIDRVRSWLGA